MTDRPTSALIAAIEDSHFTCPAGKLESSLDWQDLKARIAELEERAEAAEDGLTAAYLAGAARD